MSTKNTRYDFDFDVSKMTPEEVKAKLREAGIPFESWVKSDKQDEEVHTLPMFQRQAELLQQVASLLQDQIDRDMLEVNQLQIQLHKLKRGGGQ